eukprot:42391-Pleurochrysis_carterae.AAC.2
MRCNGDLIAGGKIALKTLLFKGVLFSVEAPCFSLSTCPALFRLLLPLTMVPRRVAQRIRTVPYRSNSRAQLSGQVLVYNSAREFDDARMPPRRARELVERDRASHEHML